MKIICHISFSDSRLYSFELVCSLLCCYLRVWCLYFELPKIMIHYLMNPIKIIWRHTSNILQTIWWMDRSKVVTWSRNAEHVAITKIIVVADLRVDFSVGFEKGLPNINSCLCGTLVACLHDIFRKLKIIISYFSCCFVFRISCPRLRNDCLSLTK